MDLKEVQTPVEMPEEVAVSEEVAEPEVPEPLPTSIPEQCRFQVTLTFADGLTKSGHAIRLERSETLKERKIESGLTMKKYR